MARKEKKRENEKAKAQGAEDQSRVEGKKNRIKVEEARGRRGRNLQGGEDLSARRALEDGELLSEAICAAPRLSEALIVGRSQHPLACHATVIESIR